MTVDTNNYPGEPARTKSSLLSVYLLKQYLYFTVSFSFTKKLVSNPLPLGSPKTNLETLPNRKFSMSELQSSMK